MILIYYYKKIKTNKYFYKNPSTICTATLELPE